VGGGGPGRRAAYREKMVELHSFLHRHAMPHGLKAQINSFYSDAWIRSLRQTDDAALLRVRGVHNQATAPYPFPPFMIGLT